MLQPRDADFPLATEPPRQVKSLGAPAKRRIFTPEQKARIVAESFASSDSVCTVARRHGLMAAQLFAWRKNARLQLERRRLDLEVRHLDENSGEKSLPSAAPKSEDEAQSSPPSTAIEISIGDIIVRVPQGCDSATLKAVLEAVHAAI